MREKNWEYKLVVLKPRGIGLEKTAAAMEEDLNRWGRQGWELVALEGSGRLAYFKR